MENIAHERPTESASVLYSPLTKRLTALLIDGFFMLAIGIILYFALGNTLISGLRNESGVREEITSFVDDAALATPEGYAFVYKAVEDDGELGATKYEDIVWKYYTVFVAKDPRAAFLESDAFDGDINDPVNVGKWVYAHVYHLNNEDSINRDLQPYYAYPDPIDYTKKPVLNESISAELESDKDEAARKLLLYWANLTVNTANPEGPYIDIFLHAQKQTYYREHAQSLQMTSYLKTLPSFIVSPLIVLLAIPMFNKYGRTPAKFFMRMAVVDWNGYRAKKWEIFLHGFILSVMLMPLALPIGQGFSSLIIAALAVLDMVMIRFNKKRQTLHEAFSFTRVIDLKESTVYDSPEEEYAGKGSFVDPSAVDAAIDTQN